LGKYLNKNLNINLILGMTIPLESATFEQKVEVQERHIEGYSEFVAFLRRIK
jgi:hypothetical protein